MINSLQKVIALPLSVYNPSLLLMVVLSEEYWESIFNTALSDGSKTTLPSNYRWSSSVIAGRLTMSTWSWPHRIATQSPIRTMCSSPWSTSTRLRTSSSRYVTLLAMSAVSDTSTTLLLKSDLQKYYLQCIGPAYFKSNPWSDGSCGVVYLYGDGKMAPHLLHKRC